MARLPTRWRPWVLGVGGGLAVLALAVTLATPYLDVPVGTATATGPSMGYEGMQVVVYADHPLASVEVGDTVIYRDGDRLVHHRVVERTPRGYVTRGDTASATDQSRGAPYVTSATLVGVVLLRMSFELTALVTAGLGVVWAGLLWTARSSWRLSTARA